MLARSKRIVSVMLIIAMIFTSGGFNALAFSPLNLGALFGSPTIEKSNTSDITSSDDGADLSSDKTYSMAEDTMSPKISSSSTINSGDEEELDNESANIEEPEEDIDKKSTTNEDKVNDDTNKDVSISDKEETNDNKNASDETDASETKRTDASDTSEADSSKDENSTKTLDTENGTSKNTTNDTNSKNKNDNTISTTSDTDSEENNKDNDTKKSTMSDTTLITTDVATKSSADDEEHFMGYIPEDFIAPVAEEKIDGRFFGDESIPLSYDSRTKMNPVCATMSIVPPTRNQGGHNTCWAFATIGLMETSLRKKGLVKSEAESNLSELALSYFTYNLENITNNSDYLDTPGLEGNDYSKVVAAGEDFGTLGGNTGIASLIASSYMGVLREDKNERLQYKDINFTNTPDGKYAFKNNDFEIKNVLFLNKNDTTAIKKAIMNYGAVAISFSGDGDNKDASSYDTVIDGEHYQFPNATQANHAIIVVGWNDNIPASNFKDYTTGATPTNPGGWLCKNSWGNYAESNNGFFWMTYEEPSIYPNMYAIEMMKADTYKYNYHYDTTGNGNFNNPFRGNQHSVCANVFKAKSDETLDAVSVVLGSTNNVFDILIYTKDSAMTNPSDGTLALLQEDVSRTYSGIYTIELDKKIKLTKDTYYSIVISEESADDGLTIGCDFNINDGEVQHVNERADGQSYYGYLQTSTYDYYLWKTDPLRFYTSQTTYSDYPYNWRIKGLTNPVPVKTPTATPSEGYYEFGPSWFDSTVAGLSKSSVDTITFLKYTEDTPEGITPWDVPNSNGLKGYTSGNNIYIYASSAAPIKMAEDASYLFSDESSTSFVGLDKIHNLNYLDTSDVVNMKGMFHFCRTLDYVDLSNFNTKKVTNMEDMFDACGYLTANSTMNYTLDLSNFDTSKVTDMSGMFSNCKKIEDLNVSSFDTSKVTDMSYMFNNCQNLKAIDVSNFDTSNVTNMMDMFAFVTSAYGEVPALKSINVSNFNTSKVTDMSRMFAAQSTLKTLDLRNFDTSNVTKIDQMFTGCSGLTKILASNKFITTKVQGDSHNYLNIFGNCTNLVGGAGTTWTSENASNINYARVDSATTPGFFSSNYEYDYILSPGWYGSDASTALGLSKEDALHIEIRTYGVDDSINLESGNYSTYELPNTSNNTTYNKNLYVCRNVFAGYTGDDELYNTIFIYAPKLDDSEDRPVMIKLAADSSELFKGFSKVKTIKGLDRLYTGEVTNMSHMFEGCSNLTSLNVSSFDTSNVTNMSYMFNRTFYESKISTLNLYGFNTKKVTNFEGMFMDAGIKNINLSSFDTSAATNMRFMFCVFASDIEGTLESLDLSGFDTSHVTDMTHMISAPNVSSLDITDLDTSNATSLEGLFWNMGKLTSIDVSSFDTSKANNIKFMFYGCENIDSLNLTNFNTNLVTDISSMFYGCKKIRTIDISSFKTNSVIDMSDLFNGCAELLLIKASTDFVVNSSANTDNMFLGCVSIIGGGDTSYDSDHVDGEYARIGSGSTPGYFTSDSVGYTITFDCKLYQDIGASIDVTNGTYQAFGMSSSTNVSAGGKVPKPTTDPVATRVNFTNYRFKGWYHYDEATNVFGDAFDFDNETVTSDMTIYAKWELVKTITFHFDLQENLDWGSSYPVPDSIEDIEVESGNKLTKPSPDPTWEGKFKFIHWYEDGEDEDVPFDFDQIIPNTSEDERWLIAKWKALYPVHFVVTRFNPPDFEDIGAAEIADVYVEENGKVTKPTPNPFASGYRFAGWYKTIDSDTGEYSDPFDFENDTITEETHLYAKWSTVLTIEFNYNLNGHGASISPSHVPEGDKLTKPATPSETGWKFKYWYENDPNTEFDFDQIIAEGSTSPRTLNAKWEPIKYYIQYDVKGGTFPTTVANPFTKTYGSDVTLATPSKIGYEFGGWYENYDATLDSYTDRYYGTTDILDVENDTKIIYAKWTEKTYPITLNDDGGTYATSYHKPTSRLYTEEITLPTKDNITKDGYVFKGWYDNDGFTGSPVTKIPANTVGPHEYWLKWNELHTVHFDVRKYESGIATDIGAVAILDVEVEDGNKLTKPTPNPTATGYIFKGWYYYTVSGGYSNDPFNFDTEVVEEDKYLFAKWEPITYEVTYHLDGGSLPSGVDNPFTKTYDMEVTLATPSKTGYEFVAWYKENTLTNVWTGEDDLTSTKDDDKDIYAKWNPITYKIRFDSNGVNATTPSEITKTYDDDITLQDPTNIPAGYEFLGWFKEAAGTNPYDGSEDLADVKNDDQVIYAKWKTALIFNANGHGTAPASVEITGTQTIYLPDITATGYTFGGWYDDADTDTATFIGGANDPVTISAPTTYYAKWTANKYYIKYNLNSNDATLPVGTTATFEKTYDTNVTLATPSRAGYTFNGWFTDNNTFNSRYKGVTDLRTTTGTSTDAVDIFAKWSANKYKISFNLGVGKATTPSDIEKTYNDNISLPNPTNVKTGWTFVGWYKESGLTNPYNGSGDLTNDNGVKKTVYAKWKAKITYSANGHGTAPAAVDVVVGEETELPSIANVTGFTFDTTNSWYEESGCTNLVGTAGTNYTVTEPKTLFAKWNENSYPIILNDDGGTYATSYQKPTSRLYTQEITLPTKDNITKDGYVFKGWYGNAGFTGSSVTKISANTEGPHEYWLKWNELYTVSFDLNKYDDEGNATDIGAASIEDVEVENGEKVSKPTVNPTAANHKFLGWYTYDTTTHLYSTNPFDFENTTITSDITIYAKWHEVQTITFSFNMNGHGTQITDAYVVEYEKLEMPATPSEVGYTFKYWYETDANTPFDFNQTIDPATGLARTLTARWGENQYTISYHNVEASKGVTWRNGYTAPANRLYTEAATLPTSADVSRVGYTFGGWYESSDFAGTAQTGITANTASNKEYWLKWNPITYDITYHVNNGALPSNTINPFTKTYGENVSLAVPRREGYTFAGWFTDDNTFNNRYEGKTDLATTQDDDKDIFAKWTENEYTITYKNVESSKGVSWKAGYTAATKRRYTEAVTLATAGEIMRNGYTFEGWYDNENYTGAPVTLIPANTVGPHTLYAKWQGIEYTVTLYAFGGKKGGADTATPSEVLTYVAGEELTLPTDYEKDGYKVLFWYEHYDENTDTYSGNTYDKVDANSYGNKVFYARYGEVFTITYLANGGSGSMAEEKVYSYDDVTLTENKFTRNGYIFNGWQGADGTRYTNGQNVGYLTSNLTLSATWRERRSDSSPSGGNSGSSSGPMSNTTPQQPQQQQQAQEKSLEQALNEGNVIRAVVSTANARVEAIVRTTERWTYDPVNNKWKLSGMNGLGQNVAAVNTFCQVTKTVNITVNGMSVQTEVNDTYYFDESGNMVTGWMQTSDNKFYFFDDSKTANEGKMSLGWKLIAAAWYYFTNNGSMQVGGTTPDGYNIGSDGKWSK